VQYRDKALRITGIEINADYGRTKKRIRVVPMPLLYMGHPMVLAREAGGWWARIDSLAVETMLFPNQESAVAEAKAFIDGCLRTPGTVATPDTVAVMLCGRPAADWPGQPIWVSGEATRSKRPRGRFGLQ
jgi:hypothetical protein